MHVVFGTGAIGSTLAARLYADGRSVRVINRSGVAPTARGIEVCRGDASDVEACVRLADGAEVVYQCLNPPYHRWTEFPQLQRNVVAAAGRAGARVVAMDNLYAYGAPGNEPFTEKHPLVPCSRKGRIRAAMSEELFAAHDAGRVQATAARASDYFGPGAASQSLIGSRVVPAALEGGVAQVVGDLDQLHSFAYVPDIAATLAMLGARDDALGAVWHVPHAPPVTIREMVSMVYAAAGTTPRMRTLSRPIVTLIGLFNPTVRELREMLYQFDQPFVVDDRRVRELTGLEPTPLDQAVQATVDWWRLKAME